MQYFSMGRVRYVAMKACGLGKIRGKDNPFSTDFPTDLETVANDVGSYA